MGRPYSAARFSASLRYDAACFSSCALNVSFVSEAASCSNSSARSKYSVSIFIGNDVHGRRTTDCTLYTLANELGHSQNQIRTLGLKYGQYP